MPTTTTSASSDVPSVEVDSDRWHRPAGGDRDPLHADAGPEGRRRGLDGARRRPHPSVRPGPGPGGSGRASTTVTVAPQSVAGGRHLRADEPGPDHHDPGRFPADGQDRARRAGQSSRVRRACTPASASVPGSRRAGPRWPRPGRRRSARRRRQGDGAGGGVERAARRPSRSSSPKVVELVRGVVVDPLDGPLPGQELLGQRRAVVGGVVLVPDDDHRPGDALVSDSSAARRPAREAPTTTTVDSGSWSRSAHPGIVRCLGEPPVRLIDRTWSSTARGSGSRNT